MHTDTYICPEEYSEAAPPNPACHPATGMTAAHAEDQGPPVAALRAHLCFFFCDSSLKR